MLGSRTSTQLLKSASLPSFLPRCLPPILLKLLSAGTCLWRQTGWQSVVI